MSARFPGLDAGYESFYVRAVDPERPRGAWLRHTIHKAPGHEPVGSIWVTLFTEGGVTAHKLSVPSPQPQPWVTIGDSAFGPGGVRGSAGPASYDLGWTGAEAPLRHLPREWMYRAPLPKTKLESPLPAAAVSGSVAIGDTSLSLDGWPGMVGHNWGTQHAERWIWLHGVAFQGDPTAWLDVAIGRVRIGPVTTPWIANGVLSRSGTRTRIGGRARVRETPLSLTAEAGGVRITATSPRERTIVWRYADPDSSEHQTANCSVARLEVDGLVTAHGGAYELGMRETTHGLPVQPFTDP